MFWGKGLVDWDDVLREFLVERLELGLAAQIEFIDDDVTGQLKVGMDSRAEFGEESPSSELSDPNMSSQLI